MSTLAGLEKKQKLIAKLLDSVPGIHGLPPKAIRHITRAVEKVFGLPKVSMRTTRTLTIPLSTCNESIRARLYEPVDYKGSTLVYFHGGGCVLGSLETHDHLSRYLAHYSGMKVISVEYRLAPEAPFPEPVYDAIDAWNWVVSNSDDLGLDSSSMGLAGDSAGGYLATIISMEKEQQSLPVKSNRIPDFQLLIYPLADVRALDESYHKFNKGLILTTGLMDFFIKHYISDPAQKEHPLASLNLSEDIPACPKTTIVSAEFDPLRDSVFAYVEKLRAANVSVEHEHLSDCMHAFPTVGRFSQRARQVTENLGLTLRKLADNA